MGTLMYGSGIEVVIDDRTLIHLQIVITGKLRRGECFFFSWHDSAAVGGGRSAIWLSRSTPIQFHMHEQDKVSINREWLDLLMTSANSSSGLQYIPEPGQEPHQPGAHLHHRPVGTEAPVPAKTSVATQ
jgi:hypothetical protein